ncbi:MAG TPA: FixH family protein [Opitutaceae bacterium]
MSRRSFIPAAVLATAALVSLLGCRPKPREPLGLLQASAQFEPNPPVAHHAVNVKVTLTDAAGKPLQLGHLDVEGDMNHAGMSPVFAHFDEITPGQYSGQIEFTMGGDWFLLLSGQLPGNTHFVKKIDVLGVKPQ